MDTADSINYWGTSIHHVYPLNLISMWETTNEAVNGANTQMMQPLG